MCHFVRSPQPQQTGGWSADIGKRKGRGVLKGEGVKEGRGRHLLFAETRQKDERRIL